MFVWEMVSCRLQRDGWVVWHSTRHDAYGPTYIVHLQRDERAHEVSGPTLTEAYAAAARCARDGSGAPLAGNAPHFGRSAVGAWT